MKARVVARLCILFLVLFAGAAQAQPRSIEDFAKFDNKSKQTIDYGIWDYFLQQNVFYNGFSDRKPGPDAQVVTQSRIKHGHGGRYSNEANRVMFSLMQRGTPDALTAYRQDLERISNEVDLTKLSRSEQLAFWLNLHKAGPARTLGPPRSLVYLRSELMPSSSLEAIVSSSPQAGMDMEPFSTRATSVNSTGSPTACFSST